MFKRNGIYIMENYWISFLMNWGILLTGWLVYWSYQIIKSHIISYSKKEQYFPIFTFLLISSTNNSMITGVPALLLLLSCYFSFNKEEPEINYGKKIHLFK